MTLSHARRPIMTVNYQTCIALRAVASQRTVWEELLRKTCRDYSHFEPSYHTESMRVRELKRATLGPQLWYTKLSKLARADSALEPLHERVIPPPCDAEPFEAAHLVPGGRYLLAMTNRSISLWDLGSLEAECVPPERLDTVQAPVGCEMAVLCEPDISSPDTIRFWAEIWEPDGDNSGTRCLR